MFLYFFLVTQSVPEPAYIHDVTKSLQPTTSLRDILMGARGVALRGLELGTWAGGANPRR